MHLPDPNGPLDQKIHPLGLLSIGKCMHACVSKLPIVDNDTGEGRNITTLFTHGLYAVLTPVQKFEIGKRAAENGTIAEI